MLGDVDHAIATFNPNEKTQDIEMLWATPEADALRADPRFPELLESVGWPCGVGRTDCGPVLN